MKKRVPESEMSDYLWWGGWLENRNGWWHPPSCLASWPLGEAYDAAKRDEAKGHRMTPRQLLEYHRDVGLRTAGAEAFYLAGPQAKAVAT